MNEEVMEQIRQVRETLTMLSDKCYSQELSACPKHPIFQPGKFINLILALPEILIKDPDQSLPKILLGYSKPGTGGGLLSADLLLKEHLVKVLPKEMR